MFIELTAVYEGRKELININKIQIIGGTESGSIIKIGETTAYYKESYEEVKALIEHEVQAERGY